MATINEEYRAVLNYLNWRDERGIESEHREAAELWRDERLAEARENALRSIEGWLRTVVAEGGLVDRDVVRSLLSVVEDAL